MKSNTSLKAERFVEGEPDASANGADTGTEMMSLFPVVVVRSC